MSLYYVKVYGQQIMYQYTGNISNLIRMEGSWHQTFYLSMFIHYDIMNVDISNFSSPDQRECDNNMLEMKTMAQ